MKVKWADDGVPVRISTWQDFRSPYGQKVHVDMSAVVAIVEVANADAAGDPQWVPGDVIAELRFSGGGVLTVILNATRYFA